MHLLRFSLFLFFLLLLFPADPGMKRQHILFRFVPQPDAGLMIMQAAMGAAVGARRQSDAFVAFLVPEGQRGVQILDHHIGSESGFQRLPWIPVTGYIYKVQRLLCFFPS